MTRLQLLTTVALISCLSGPEAEGQLLFDWPLRAAPQPEAILTGAGAVFWNPGSLVPEVGTTREILIIHVDGPDVTGVGGVAFSGVVELPIGLQGGFGYRHLGTGGIPRTTNSPHQEIGDVDVSEDAVIFALAGSIAGQTGVGGGISVQRGAAGIETKSRIEGEIGVHHQSTLPWAPRIGFVIKGLGGTLRPQGGAEVSLPPLASARVPIHLGYGIQADRSLKPVDHRVSLRGSWMDQLHLGMGFSYLGKGNGWTPLWMLGAKVGRYSVSVLRESLANGFGAVHFFQAAVRFP